MGYSPASIEHIGPARAEKVVASAITQTATINASRGRQDRKAQKRRRDALRSIRGREEPGHPGCSCAMPHTAYGSNPRGHRSDCIAWRTAFSREDQLEALYGDKL
jgi:hypothetical protein